MCAGHGDRSGPSLFRFSKQEKVAPVRLMVRDSRHGRRRSGPTRPAAPLWVVQGVLLCREPRRTGPERPAWPADDAARLLRPARMACVRAPFHHGKCGAAPLPRRWTQTIGRGCNRHGRTGRPVSLALWYCRLFGWRRRTRYVAASATRCRACPTTSAPVTTATSG